jgi:hypothetical protein
MLSVMNSDLSGPLSAFVFAGVVSYVFWRTYKDPTRDRLTRFVYRYAEIATIPQIMTLQMARWTTSVVGAAVALMGLGVAIGQIWQLMQSSCASETR